MSRIRSSSRAGQAAVSILGAVALVGTSLAALLGNGAAAVTMPLRDGAAWVQSLVTGSLERLDTGTGVVGYRLRTPLANRPLEIVDDGTTTVLRDPATGAIRSIDLSGAKAKLSDPTDLAREARLVSGAGHTFVLLSERGEVAALDPRSLAVGEPIDLGGPLGAAAVDGAGTLWVAVPSLGIVVPLRVGAGGLTAGRPATVRSGPGVEITVSAGVAYGVDRTEGLLLRLAPGRASEVAKVPVGAVVAPSQGDPADGHVVVGDPSGAILRIDATTGASTRFELGDRAGNELGPPVQARNRITIPDLTTGELVVIDPSSGTSEAARVRTGSRPGRRGTPSAGPVPVVAADGAVVANDPGSTIAVVVTPLGAAEVVDKAGSAPGAEADQEPTPAPAPLVLPTPTPLPATLPALPLSAPLAAPAPAGGPTPAPGTAPGPAASPVPVPGAVGPSAAPTTPTTPTRPPAAPGAVRNLTAVAGDAAIDLSWSTAPTGGSPLLAHQVQCTPTGAAPVTQDVAGAATGATFDRLANGVEHRCTVTPRNAVGPGPPASAGPVRPVAGVPGKPTNVVATGGNGTIRVTWSAPVDGGRVNRYLVMATTTDGYSSVEVYDHDTTLEGVVNGQQYQVTVRALFGDAAGPPAAAPGPVTPGGLPGAPQAVAVSARSRAIAVSWRPAPANGSPLTGYTVTAQPGGHRRDLPATADAVEIDGLTNGLTYTVTVVATNGQGAGPASAPKTAVPGAPEIGPVTAEPQPGPDGGKPLTILVRFVVDWKGETPVSCSIELKQLNDSSGLAPATLTDPGCAPSYRIGATYETTYGLTAVARYAGGEVRRGPSTVTTPPAPRVYLTRSMQYTPRDWFYGRPEEGTPFELVQESDIWVYTELMPGTVKLLRWRDARTSAHCYGTEGQAPPPGFSVDATLGYIHTQPGPGRPDIRRYVRQDFQGPTQGLDCFLPASAGQYAELEPAKWTDQGNIGYGAPPP